MSKEERNLEFLQYIVERIYLVMRRTEFYVYAHYTEVKPILPEEITFVHSLELEKSYPDLAPREREDAACKEHGAVFIIGIGAALANGKPHDGRAPDYDDWITPTDIGPGLNGDIIVWNPVLEKAFELSSMGIRVDPASLDKQLEITRTTERRELLFHKKLLSDELPLSVGGGIG
jgi:aspartate--ammonia ligase